VSIIRAIALVSMVAVRGSTALAARSVQADRTIVDPIQRSTGGNHPYAGPNLELFANLSRAGRVGAELIGANLTGADLTNAHLGGSVLNFADLRGASLAATTYLGLRAARRPTLLRRTSRTTAGATSACGPSRGRCLI
jgi:hypothetical protein